MGRHKIKNLMYGIPIALASLMPMKAHGQIVIPYATGVINPFISADNTETAIIYNNLNSKTKAERDNLLDARIKASRVHTIPSHDNPVWNCNNWSLLQAVNAHDWGENVYDSQWNRLLYNGYNGFDLNEIYANGGTLADAGKDGLPMFAVSIYDPVTRPEGHAMDGVFTGNNILDPNSFNTIEPRDGVTNVQPGQINIPMNCERFIIAYPYLYKNDAHDKNLTGQRIMEFKIVNGQKILTYNINDDPLFNNRVRIITQRESDPPTIDVKQGTDLDSLVCTLRDANLKSAWYTIDNGEKIPLMTEVLQQVTEKKIAIKMNLPTGTHQIKIGADDYFRLNSEKTIERTIEQTNNPPIITFITPKNGQTYDKDITLQYTITDNDFDKATYRIDNGTKISASQNGTIPLTLTDGIHKIVIEATDKKPQTSKDSVSFEIKKATAIDGTSFTEGIRVYPIPVKDFLNIEYKFNTEQKIQRELYDMNGRLLYNDWVEITGEQTDKLDMSKYSSGIYLLKQVMEKGVKRDKIFKR